MNDFKWSKPSWYRGTLFRSRLEVKWASFFNKLKIRWEYEQHGFPHIQYLPDFYFPDLDIFFEAKGFLDGTDVRKISDLARITGKNVVIGYGDYRAQMVYVDSMEKRASSAPPDLVFHDEVLLIQCQKAKCKKRFFRPRAYLEDVCPFCGEKLTNLKNAIRREFFCKEQYIPKKKDKKELEEEFDLQLKFDPITQNFYKINKKGKKIYVDRTEGVL